jgi:thiamine-phosphate pyrophosphorylase
MKHFEKLAGLYLVVSPIMATEKLLSATEKALDGGVDILQFSATKETADTYVMVSVLAGLAKKHKIPFLINNNLKLAKKVKADGVHFDAYDVSSVEARRVLGSHCIVGYSVNIDIEKIRWAEQAGADYISFCSIFHQCPSNECPIVPLDTVKNAASATNLSVFAAGGINLENILLVLDSGVDGVAVTSAILKSKNPQQTAEEFKQVIEKYGKKR